jgi:hypothetical protein
MLPVDENGNIQIFEDVWQNANSRINALETDTKDILFAQALVMGGTVAAEAVVTSCKSIKEFWGEGNENAAVGLSQFFSVILLGQLYRWLRKNPQESTAAVVSPEVNIKLLSVIYVGNLEQMMDDYTNFDRQFDSDLKISSSLTRVCGLLLLSRASEICGRKCFDWKKVAFPVTEIKELVGKAAIEGAPMRVILDVHPMQKSLDAGMQALTGYYVKS